MLTKKMYPQNSSRASSTKKYLRDNRHTSNAEKQDEQQEKRCDGSKWDKTDSECKFVLYSFSISDSQFSI